MHGGFVKVRTAAALGQLRQINFLMDQVNLTEYTMQSLPLPGRILCPISQVGLLLVCLVTRNTGGAG